MTRLQRVQRRHSGLLVALAIAVLALPTLLKLPLELSFIFWNPDRGAVDLRYYFDWVRDWTAGHNVYLRPDRPEYPPASLPLLYALVGWLDWAGARVLMGTASLCGIATLVAVAIRGSRARSWAQTILAALLVLSSNGPNVALGNGQLSTIALPLILVGLFLLHRRPALWRYDLAAASMLTWALVKPSLTAPFLWLAVVYPDRLRFRPLLLTGALYAALTIFALSFFDAPILDGLLMPVRNGLEVATTAFDPNIHYALYRLGLSVLMLPATALAFVLLGVWIRRYRSLDLWLLLALTALVARFWTYHRVYENVLLLLPEIALWRIWQDRQARDQSVAPLVLLVLNAFVIVAPGGVTSPPRWLDVMTFVTQGLVWLPTLVFLAWYAERQVRRASLRASSGCGADP